MFESLRTNLDDLMQHQQLGIKSDDPKMLETALDQTKKVESQTLLLLRQKDQEISDC